MLEDANSSQVFSYNTEFVNSNCTAFFAGLLRTSASSFTGPSPHPSPSPCLPSLTSGKEYGLIREKRWRTSPKRLPLLWKVLIQLLFQTSSPSYRFLQQSLLHLVPVRSISCLRYLKNYLRGAMGEERLNGLALVHAHREIALDLDEIINLLASLHPRWMRMASILCSDD